jgi:radical SAM superfamily enzyme YgiQ (UPF0313 family)
MPSRKSIGLHNLMICEPLELEYAAAFLKKNGHQVEFRDLILEKRGLKYFLEQTKPDMVGFTSYITHVNVVKEYAKQAKEFNQRIITFVGGVHSEVMVDDFRDENLDYVLGKNGLKNLGLLCEAIVKHEKPIFQTDIIFHDYVLPFPDREITNSYRARYDYAFHAPCALIKTSYGCSYDCKFCFCREVTGRHYSERNLEDVILELQGIKEKNIFIVDDNFLFNRQRVEVFCDLLVENKINKKFIIFGRADFIAGNKALIKKFNSCGLEAVFVGVETFKKEELDNFNKRSSVDINEKAISILNELKIDCYAGIIVGPDWSKDDFKNLIRWMKRMNLMFVNIQPLTPLPGTEIFNEYKDKLLFDRNEYEKWDLTHIVIQPTQMSISRFYLEIIKAYLGSTSSIKTYVYIQKKYGRKMANKSFRGALHILIQYILLMIKSSLNEKNSIDTANDI